MRYRERDSLKSREDILRAAEEEFSEKGFFGTRVDEIANKANINKRMIYEYFGNKEELYKAVLSDSYSKLSRAELVLLSKDAPVTESIKQIVKLYFEFLKTNPSYVNLIMWENLNKGKYIEGIDLSSIKDPVFEILKSILKKGKKEKVFKNELDEEQLILSLLTFTFSYFSNRYTLSKLLDIKLEDDENIARRIEYVTDMFLAYISA